MDQKDNEWTVATLKTYFEALRKEDHRAVELLAKGITDRFNALIAFVTIIALVIGAWRVLHP